jgi:hypothetical protein
MRAPDGADIAWVADGATHRLTEAPSYLVGITHIYDAYHIVF